MKIDGVNFYEDAVAKMNREDFIAMHVGVFWQDRDEETRLKMLSDVYQRICGPKPKKQKKES